MKQGTEKMTKKYNNFGGLTSYASCAEDALPKGFDI